MSGGEDHCPAFPASHRHSHLVAVAAAVAVAVVAVVAAVESRKKMLLPNLPISMGVLLFWHVRDRERLWEMVWVNS